MTRPVRVLIASALAFGLGVTVLMLIAMAFASARGWQVTVDFNIYGEAVPEILLFVAGVVLIVAAIAAVLRSR